MYDSCGKNLKYRASNLMLVMPEGAVTVAVIPNLPFRC